MTTLTASFRGEGEKVHDEHLVLAQVLYKLDSALDRLVCYPEVYASLASAAQVRRYGRQLIEQFPEHCRREEALLLGPISGVSPELAEFCNEIKKEHCELLARLGTFRAALHEFDKGQDINEAVSRLKEAGKELARAMRLHVAKEEKELSGFL